MHPTVRYSGNCGEVAQDSSKASVSIGGVRFLSKVSSVLCFSGVGLATRKRLIIVDCGKSCAQAVRGRGGERSQETDNPMLEPDPAFRPLQRQGRTSHGGTHSTSTNFETFDAMIL